MCNIYKNNLIVLSQIEDNQLIYYKEETNKLKIDDRYLSYFHSDNNVQKIADIVNTCFLQLSNNYIVNIAQADNLHLLEEVPETSNLEDSIKEIKNTKALLRNSLKGINTYYQTLEKNNYDYTPIQELYQKLTPIFDNLENYKENYIGKINERSSPKTESNSWLYKLYQSTIKSTVEKQPIKLSTETITTTDNQTFAEENQGDDICDNSCPPIEETESYVLGFIYIVSRKVSNFIISVGRHLKILFR